MADQFPPTPTSFAAPAPASFAAPAPASFAAPAPAREENVSALELSVEEAEAMFASQTRPGANRAGGTAVMDESDMDRLLRALDIADSDQHAWLPSWAKAAPAAPKYGYSDVYGEDDDGCAGDSDRLLSISQAVRDLDVAVATIDDTTVAIRDTVCDLAEDVKAAQQQLGAIEEDAVLVKAQNVALVEEVRELRYSFVAMRQTLAQLTGALRLVLARAAEPTAAGPAAVEPVAAAEPVAAEPA